MPLMWLQLFILVYPEMPFPHGQQLPRWYVNACQVQTRSLEIVEKIQERVLYSHNHRITWAATTTGHSRSNSSLGKVRWGFITVQLCQRKNRVVEFYQPSLKSQCPEYKIHGWDILWQTPREGHDIIFVVRPKWFMKTIQHHSHPSWVQFEVANMVLRPWAEDDDFLCHT